MVTLNIRKHAIRMPSKLSEIPLYKGIQIMELLSEQKETYEIKVAIISLLSDLDVSIIMLFEEDSLNEIYDQLELVNKDNLTLTFFNTFKLKGTTYGLLDLDSINVRDFAELEFWINEGDQPFTYIGELLSIMFRPITQRNTSIRNILRNIIIRLNYKMLIPKSFNSYKIEDYNDKHIENKNIFLEHLDFNFGYALFNYLFSFKSKLRDEYPILFKSDEQLNEMEKDHFKGDPTIKEFEDIWGFYYIIEQISNDLREEAIWYEKPLKELYKRLSYNKQKILNDGR